MAMQNETFWRIAWSRDWKERTPWSLDSKPMPYIGYRKSLAAPVWLYTLGPVSLTRIVLS